MTIKNIISIIPLLIFITSCTDIKFDSEKWKSWKENESNMHMRWDMADDLINNYQLEGKTIKELDRLIGSLPEDCSDGNCDYYVELGPCRTGINYGSLHIEINKGTVVHVEKHCN